MSEKPAETFDKVTVRTGGSYVVDPKTGKALPNPEPGEDATPAEETGDQPNKKVK